MKHPIGFRPSFPKLIVLPEERPRAKKPEENADRLADAVASVTLYDDGLVPYEDRAKEKRNGDDERGND